MEDVALEPPTDINPYEVLQLDTTASPEEVKSAYKRSALRHHPDKVAESARQTAHIKFQEIAFAYAILSEPRRRQRYDATGNTSESIDTEADFDWSAFYKARFADAVTGEKLHNFKESYQNSDEEIRDVMAAYTVSKGDMNKVFDQVMLSNPLSDESRFRLIIENAIQAGDLEAFAVFNEEPESRRVKRQRRAAKESAEAMEYAKELGVYDTLFPANKASTHKNTNGRTKARTSRKEQEMQDEAGLAALIQKKNPQAKTNQFLDDLEAKYAGKKGKKRKFEEPPEELFQQNRQTKRGAPEAEVEVEYGDEDKEEIDDRVPDVLKSEVDDDAEDDNGVTAKPARSKRGQLKHPNGGKDTSSKRANKKVIAKSVNTKEGSTRKAKSKKS